MSIEIIGTQIDRTEQAPVVLGSEKIPTGGRGLYHVTVDQVRDYILNHFGKESIHLGDVDNTSDENKPLSKATREALSKKLSKTEPYVESINGLTGNIDLVPTLIGLGNVDNTSDKDKPLSDLAVRALATKLDKTTFKDFKRLYDIFEKAVNDKFIKLDKVDKELLERVRLLEAEDKFIHTLIEDLTQYVNDEIYRVSTTLSEEQLELLDQFMFDNFDRYLIVSSFFEQELKNIYSHLASEISKVATSLEELGLEDQNLKQSIETLTSQLNVRFASISAEILEVDFKLDSLSNTFSRQLREAQDYIEAQIAQLRPLIEQAGNNYLKDLNDLQQTINKENNDLKDQINKIQNDIENQSDEMIILNFNLNSKHDELLDLMNSTGKSLEELIASATEEAKRDMNDLGYQMSDLSVAIDKRYDEVYGIVETQVESTKIIMNDRVRESEDLIKQAKDDIDKTRKEIEELVKESFGTAADYDKKLEELAGQISERDRELLDKLAQEVVDRNLAINQKAEDILKDIERKLNNLDLVAVEELNKKIDALNKKIEENSATLSQEVVDYITGRIEEYDTKVSDKVDDLVGKLTLDQLDRLGRISALEDGIANEILFRQEQDEEILKEVRNYKVSNDQALANYQESVETVVNDKIASSEVIKALDTKMQGIDEETGKLIESVSSVVSKAESAATLAESTASTLEAVTTEYQANDAVVRGLIAEETKNRSDALGNITERLNTISSSYTAISAPGRNLLKSSNIELIRELDEYLLGSYEVGEAITEGDDYTLMVCITHNVPEDDNAPASIKAYQDALTTISLGETKGLGRNVVHKTFKAQVGGFKNVSFFYEPSTTKTGLAIVHWAVLVKGTSIAVTDWIESPFDSEARELQTQASISNLQTVLTEADKALAEDIKETKASLTDQGLEIEAKILEVSTAVTTLDDATASKFDSVDAKFVTAESETKALVAEESKARSDALSATTDYINTFRTSFAGTGVNLLPSMYSDPDRVRKVVTDLDVAIKLREENEGQSGQWVLTRNSNKKAEINFADSFSDYSSLELRPGTSYIISAWVSAQPLDVTLTFELVTNTNEVFGVDLIIEKDGRISGVVTTGLNSNITNGYLRVSFDSEDLSLVSSISLYHLMVERQIGDGVTPSEWAPSNFNTNANITQQIKTVTDANKSLIEKFDILATTVEENDTSVKGLIAEEIKNISDINGNTISELKSLQSKFDNQRVGTENLWWLSTDRTITKGSFDVMSQTDDSQHQVLVLTGLSEGEGEVEWSNLRPTSATPLDKKETYAVSFQIKSETISDIKVTLSIFSNTNPIEDQVITLLPGSWTTLKFNELLHDENKDSSVNYSGKLKISFTAKSSDVNSSIEIREVQLQKGTTTSSYTKPSWVTQDEYKAIVEAAVTEERVARTTENEAFLSDIESLKTTMETDKGELTGLIATESLNRTTELGNLTQRLDTLSSSAENATIGGANLVPYSNIFEKGVVGNNGLITEVLEDASLKLTTTSTTLSTYISNFWSSEINMDEVIEDFKNGETNIVISFWVKAVDINNVPSALPSIYLAGNYNYKPFTNSIGSLSAGNWVQYYALYSLDNGPITSFDLRIQFNKNTLAGGLIIGKWKIELGEKPTDWSDYREISKIFDSRLNASISTLNKTITDNEKATANSLSTVNAVLTSMPNAGINLLRATVTNPSDLTEFLNKDSTDISVELYTTDFDARLKGLKFTNNTAENSTYIFSKTLSPDFTQLTKGTYILSYWAKSGTNGHTIKFGLQLDASIVNDALSSPPLTTSLVRYAVPITVDEDGYYSLQVVLNEPLVKGRVIHIERLMLEQQYANKMTPSKWVPGQENSPYSLVPVEYSQANIARELETTVEKGKAEAKRVDTLTAVVDENDVFAKGRLVEIAESITTLEGNTTTKMSSMESEFTSKLLKGKGNLWIYKDTTLVSSTIPLVKNTEDYSFTISSAGGSKIALRQPVLEDAPKLSSSSVLSFKLKVISGSVKSISIDTSNYFSIDTALINNEPVTVDRNYVVLPSSVTAGEIDVVVVLKRVNKSAVNLSIGINLLEGAVNNPYECSFKELSFNEGEVRFPWALAPADQQEEVASTKALINTSQSIATKANEALADRLDTLATNVANNQTEVSGEISRLDKAQTTLEGSTATSFSKIETKFKTLPNNGVNLLPSVLANPSHTTLSLYGSFTTAIEPSTIEPTVNRWAIASIGVTASKYVRFTPNGLSSSNFTLPVHTDYIFSCYVYTEEDITDLQISVKITGNIAYPFTLTKSGTVTRISCKFSVVTSTSKISFDIYPNVGSTVTPTKFYVERLMVEACIGDSVEPSPWTNGTSDISRQISASAESVTKAYTTANEAIAKRIDNLSAAFDGQSIGGSNLWTITDKNTTFATYGGTGTRTIVNEDQEHVSYQILTFASSGNGGFRHDNCLVSKSLTLVSGVDYVLTFQIKAPRSALVVATVYMGSTAGQGGTLDITTVSNTWIKVSIPVKSKGATLTKTAQSLILVANSSNGWAVNDVIELKNVQLQEGTKATSFVRANQLLVDKINLVNADITSHKEAYASDKEANALVIDTMKSTFRSNAGSLVPDYNLALKDEWVNTYASKVDTFFTEVTDGPVSETAYMNNGSYSFVFNKTPLSVGKSYVISYWAKHEEGANGSNYVLIGKPSNTDPTKPISFKNVNVASQIIADGVWREISYTVKSTELPPKSWFAGFAVNHNDTAKKSSWVQGFKVTAVLTDKDIDESVTSAAKLTSVSQTLSNETKAVSEKMDKYSSEITDKFTQVEGSILEVNSTIATLDGVINKKIDTLEGSYDKVNESLNLKVDSKTLEEYSTVTDRDKAIASKIEAFATSWTSGGNGVNLIPPAYASPVDPTTTIANTGGTLSMVACDLAPSLLAYSFTPNENATLTNYFTVATANNNLLIPIDNTEVTNYILSFYVKADKDVKLRFGVRYKTKNSSTFTFNTTIVDVTTEWERVSYVAKLAASVEIFSITGHPYYGSPGNIQVTAFMAEVQTVPENTKPSPFPFLASLATTANALANTVTKAEVKKVGDDLVSASSRMTSLGNSINRIAKSLTIDSSLDIVNDLTVNPSYNTVTYTGVTEEKSGTGGRVITIGTQGSATTNFIAHHKNFLPFDESRTYRLRYRYRNKGPSLSTVYVSVSMRKADQVTYITSQNVTSTSIATMAITGAYVTSSKVATWIEGEVFIKGRAATIVSGSATLKDPLKLPADVAYISPLIRVSYNDSLEIDFVSLEESDAYSKVQITANALETLTTDVSTMGGTVSTTAAKTLSLEGRVDTAEGLLSTAVQASVLEKSYATHEATLSAMAGKITEYNSSLVLGGSNLHPGTETDWAKVWSTDALMTVNDKPAGYKTKTITCASKTKKTNTNTAITSSATNLKVSFVKDSSYTLSFLARGNVKALDYSGAIAANTDGLNLLVKIQNAGSDDLAMSTTVFKRYSAVFTALNTTDAGGILIGFKTTLADATEWIEVAEVTVNEGKIPVAWSNSMLDTSKMLDAQATAIGNRYTKTEADEKTLTVVAGELSKFSVSLQQAGNNFVEDFDFTRNYWTFNKNGSTGTGTIAAENWLEIVSVNNAGSPQWVLSSAKAKKLKTITPQTITLTFDAYLLSGTSNVLEVTLKGATVGTTRFETFTVTPTIQRFKKSITALDFTKETGLVELIFTHKTSIGTLRIKNIQIELGENATPFQPAKEDLQYSLKLNADATKLVETWVEDNRSNVADITAIRSKTDAIRNDYDNTENLIRAIGSGKLLYDDPTFKNGLNDIKAYDYKTGVFTLERKTKQTTNPTSSTHEIVIIATAEGETQRAGGFYSIFTSRSNAVFLSKYILCVPVGYDVVPAANHLGDYYSDIIIGNAKGTGKYETYFRVTRCGSVGAFSTGGHVTFIRNSDFTGTISASSPVTFYLASIETYDVTDYDSTTPALKQAISEYTSIASTLTDADSAQGFKSEQLKSSFATDGYSAQLPLAMNYSQSAKWLSIQYTRPTELNATTMFEYAQINKIKPLSSGYVTQATSETTSATTTYNMAAQTIAVYRTMVFVSTAKTVSWKTFIGNDLWKVLVNGTTVSSGTYTTAGATLSLVLKSGWNAVDVFINNGTGGGGFYNTVALSTLVDRMFAPDAADILTNNMATILNSYYTKSDIDESVAQKITGVSAEYALSLVTAPDTRNVDQPPSYYWSDYKRRTVNEFKSATAIGKPGGLTALGTLQTTVPWNDKSGGAIQQLFTTSDVSLNTWSRYSLSETTWSEWVNSLAKLRTDLEKNVADIKQEYIAKSDAEETVGKLVTTISAKIASDNLLPNGDFSKGAVLPWRDYLPTYAGFTIYTDETNRRWGRYTYAANSTSYKGLAHTLRLVDNELLGSTEYTVSFKAKAANSTTKKLYLYVQLFKTSGSNSNLPANFDITTTDESYCAFTFTTPVDLTSIVLMFYGATNTDLDFLITDVQVQKGSVPTAYQKSALELSSAVQITAEAVSGSKGITSKYTVKVDTGGLISGYGLIGEENNGKPVSAFAVNATQFYVGSPTDNKKPFIVLTSPGTIGGVSVPAGTYMDTAFIGDATITNAKVSNLDAAKITTGVLNAARIRVGSSSSYDEGYNPATNLQTAKDYTDIDSYSNMKTFNNVTGYSTRTSSFTNTLVIKTPLLLKGYMTKLMLSGYQYAASEETSYSIEIAFYAYTAATPFTNFRVKATGISLSNVSLALDSNSQVVILVNKVSAWRYPIITLDKAIVGYTLPPDSFKDGWSLNFETDVTGYTVSSANIPIDQAETVDGATAKVAAVQSQITDIAADNKLTAVEKKSVKLIWSEIQKEYSGLAEKCKALELAYASLTTAYNTLNSYITPLLSNVNTTSDIVRSTFESNFNKYYTEVAALEPVINTWIVNVAADTVVVGGSNFLDYTSDYSRSWGRGSQYSSSSSTIVDKGVVELTNTATGWSIWYATGLMNKSLATVEPNKTYTISAEFMAMDAAAAKTGAWLSLRRQDSGSYAEAFVKYLGSDQLTVGTWVKVSATGSTGAAPGSHWTAITGFSAIGTVRIRRIKLEEGNKATAWLPSVYDTTVGTQLGGNNLLLRSKSNDTVLSWTSGATVTVKAAETGLRTTIVRLVPTSSSLANVGIYYPKNMPMIADEAYCLSFLVRGNASNLNYTYSLSTSSSGDNQHLGSSFVIPKLSTTAWQKVSIPFYPALTTNRGSVLIGFRTTLTNNSEWAEFAEVVVNKGPRDIDWVEAIEDSNTYTDEKLTNFRIGGTNIFPIALTKAGHISAGTVTSTAGTAENHRLYDEFVAIPTGARRLIYQCWNPAGIVSTNSNRVNFFNSSKTYLSQVAVTKLTASVYDLLTIDIPTNAAYVKLGAILGATSVIDPSIRVKFEFGDNPTDWSSAEGDLQGQWEKYLALNTGNLLNNVTLSGTTERWSAGTPANVSFKSTTVASHLLTSSGDLTAFSDTFAVDPSKAYEVSMWFKKDQQVGNIYFGAYPYNASKSRIGINVISNLTGNDSTTANTNPYFWSVGATSIDTDWVKIVAYIMPAGTDSKDMKGIGSGTTSNFRMLPNTAYMAIRFLNFYNSGTETNLWVVNAKCVEVDPTVVIAASAASQLAGSKAITYTSTPTPPYNIGDIWKDGTTIRISTAARSTYSANDWVLVGDITANNTSADSLKLGGTLADTVLKNATAGANIAADILSDLIVTPVEKTALYNEYNRIKAEYTSQLAQANALGITATTYTTAYTAIDGTAPKMSTILSSMTTSTTLTTTERNNFRTQLNTYYTQATNMAKSITTAVTDKADSKAKTFTSTPTTPYSSGDIWKDGVTIKVSTTNRSSTASYTASDWVLVGDITANNTSADSLKLGGTLAATVINNAATGSSMAADILSDLVVTPVEKTALYNEWNRIKAEYTNQLAQANTLSITVTSYTNAYNAIDSTAPKISTILSSMTTSTTLTTTERNNFRTQLNTYYTQATTIAKSITQAVIDKAAKETKDVGDSVTSVLTTVNQMSADNYLTPLEKQQSKTIWESITRPHADLLAQAAAVNATTNAYVSAYNTLNTYLTNLFSNMTTTSTITRTTFNTNFANLYTQKSALEKSITDAGLTVGGDNLLDNSSFTDSITGWTKSSSATATIVSQSPGNGATKCLSLVLTTASTGVYQSLKSRYTATYTPVTISFWAKAATSGLSLKVSTEGHTGTTTFELTTSWKYYTSTLSKTAANPNIIIYGTAAGTYYVSQIQYEKGVTASAWRPSSYELVSSITDADSKATTANDTVNSWKTPNTTTIDGGKITTNTITATQISVSNLSSLSANLGTISVGTANIANAAITTAKIGDLSVSSLKIADNAVTIPATSYSASAVVVSSSTWTDVVSLYVEASEGQSLIMFNTTYNVDDAGGVDVRCRILRGSTVVRDEFQIIAAGLVGGNSIRPSGSASTNYLETGKQNATITVQFRLDGGPKVSLTHRSLTSLVVKK